MTAYKLCGNTEVLAWYMVADAYFCLPEYVGNIDLYIDLYIDHFVNSPCYSYSALTESVYLSHFTSSYSWCLWWDFKAWLNVTRLSMDRGPVFQRVKEHLEKLENPSGNNSVDDIQSCRSGILLTQMLSCVPLGPALFQIICLCLCHIS